MFDILQLSSLNNNKTRWCMGKNRSNCYDYKHENLTAINIFLQSWADFYNACLLVAEQKLIQSVDNHLGHAPARTNGANGKLPIQSLLQLRGKIGLGSQACLDKVGHLQGWDICAFAKSGLRIRKYLSMVPNVRTRDANQKFNIKLNAKPRHPNSMLIQSRSLLPAKLFGPAVVLSVVIVTITLHIRVWRMKLFLITFNIVSIFPGPGYNAMLEVYNLT